MMDDDDDKKQTSGPTAPSDVRPVTNRVAGPPTEEELAWLDRIAAGMKRMSEDEEYRREIAKHTF